ncbi:MAG: preprotein translocase subunit SecE [Saprospiraceae bacterium]|nr:preprotein translocase subunit SecE [Saprospiraceae bacterium]MCB9309580.1 preprotein translocase subunit SecE [Lewinellaceae bacterium]
MENIKLYLQESYDELVHHVTWPTWPELISNAKLVFVATFILASIIFLFDLVAKNVLSLIYGIN